jgi:MFS family permease
LVASREFILVWLKFARLELLLAVFGVIADRQSSRRLPFVLGLVALAASTALFTLGRSPAAFLLARAFQGLSAAAVWIVGLALLVDTVGKDKIGQAMGIAGIAMTWAMMSAPVVGGFM